MRLRCVRDLKSIPHSNFSGRGWREMKHEMTRRSGSEGCLSDGNKLMGQDDEVNLLEKEKEKRGSEEAS